MQFSCKFKKKNKNLLIFFEVPVNFQENQMIFEKNIFIQFLQRFRYVLKIIDIINIINIPDMRGLNENFSHFQETCKIYNF